MKKLTFDDTKMEMVMAWLGLALWRCGVVTGDPLQARLSVRC
jgi:hypothetical protein